MTVYELMDKTRKTEPHYFDHDTLKWFGERISEMRILNGTTSITDVCGTVYPKCITLSKLSRKHPGGARRTYAYFDTETWEQVFPQ